MAKMYKIAEGGVWYVNGVLCGCKVKEMVLRGCIFGL